LQDVSPLITRTFFRAGHEFGISFAVLSLTNQTQPAAGGQILFASETVSSQTVVTSGHRPDLETTTTEFAIRQKKGFARARRFHVEMNF
jgi:hypothetical protein